MWKKITLLVLILAALQTAWGQSPRRWNSGDIHDAIVKLNFLGSALYVAAHPDDENTRLISYLANDVKANVAYLSLTRGDGGQNLVGPEIEELLGVIRTQELLAARRIDGGRQFFSRANDFGFSKHPDETLQIWNRDEVLSDVVWAIRRWQPDIIINRFDHRSPGRTHGHHTASGMLSHEAFELSADPKAYPAQLQYVKPWQPKRLFFNTSWWFFGSREKFEQADKSAMVAIDAGVYYPVKGKSNPEIAAESRSMHKSQGFGSIGTRGQEMEYLELLKGDMPAVKTDLFAGINTTWSRVEGGADIGILLEEVARNFNHNDPSASLTGLLKVYRMIKALPDGYWRNTKLEETKNIIKACAGLFLEAIASDYSATPGETISLAVEAISRCNTPITLKSVSYLPMQADSVLSLNMEENTGYKWSKLLKLPQDMPYSNAYWLNTPWPLGMYNVADQTLRGLPETPRVFKVRFTMIINGEPIDYEVEVTYKREDSVKGEVYRPFEITPPIFANLAEKVYVFANKEPQTVSLVLKSGKADAAGTVSLRLPQGWKAEPQEQAFTLKLKGEEKTVNFQLYPPKEASDAFIKPEVKVNGQTYTKEIYVTGYDHIPAQTVLRESEARVVKIDLQRAGDKIGYIMGAGDQVPASLRQIGYEVTILEDRDITPEQLRQFDAVIMGVRAYNTVERLKFHQPKLMDYVQNGGTLIVQYNTNFELVIPMEELTPYPLKLSRDRVTVEESEVRFLQPEHQVLNYPNKITAKDFEGWVQERGLYFPNEWDSRYQAILSCNDPGETPKDGGLLVAKYGQGHFVYTGYSWFRELPSGVPGAFRLFANLIAVGREIK